MSTTTEKPATQVVIGPVRLSYLNAWEPKQINGKGDPKYSASIIIDKLDKKSVDIVNKAVEAAKLEGKAKWGGKIPAKLKLPVRDGDEEREDTAYENSFFLNASSKTKPGIVDRNRKPIIDQDEVYSGVYAMVSLNFYPFDKEGNKGVACGLNHIMKMKDGEPLAGRISVDDAFSGVEFTDEAGEFD
jgi:hypothetical protein